jgi:hypothetical protein
MEFIFQYFRYIIISLTIQFKLYILYKKYLICDMPYEQEYFQICLFELDLKVYVFLKILIFIVIHKMLLGECMITLHNFLINN